MKPTGVWQWFFGVVCEYWQKTLFIAMAIVVSAGTGIAFPIVWQMVFDQAIEGNPNRWLIVLFAALFLANIVPMVRPLRALLISEYEADLRCFLFKHVLRLSIPFHKDKESAEAVLESGKGVSAGTQLLQHLLHGGLLVDVPVAVFSLCYVASYSLAAAGVLVVFMLALLATSTLLGRKVSMLNEEEELLDNEVSIRQREVLQHVEVVKLHKAEPCEEAWAQTQAEKQRQINNRLNWYQALFDLFGGAARALPVCISLLIFAPSVADGSITIGVLIALQIFSIRAVAPAGFIADTYQIFKKNSAKLKPALELLQQKPTVLESPHPVNMNPLRHELRFCDVTFTYPGTSAPALTDISFCIKAGEKVAIVGKTGSGKTSLVRLLVRFYDPDEGIITMDGTDLRQISFESLYQQVSYAPQEISIFSGTIGANVAYGLSAESKDSIEVACNNASADFIFSRENGLETKVGELGEKLSGGERQRLALARIFLRRPSLVILDEATSSLDNVTEESVQKAFDGLLGLGSTMVVIAHRISTVRNADKIIVLDKGRIVAIGTHKELLGRCRIYQDLCRAPVDYALAE